MQAKTIFNIDCNTIQLESKNIENKNNYTFNEIKL
jgi:hypothetical protein